MCIPLPSDALELELRTAAWETDSKQFVTFDLLTAVLKRAKNHKQHQYLLTLNTRCAGDSLKAIQRIIKSKYMHWHCVHACA